MKGTVEKYYLGAWHNIYHINWPVRFLLEMLVFIFIFFFIFKVVQCIGIKFKLKIPIVTAWFWLVTETIYLVGHNSDWAITFDNKMHDWASETINENKKKNIPLVLKIGCCLGVLIIYLLAVLVDLPVSRYFSEYYLEELEEVKFFFQKYESELSKGYEKYPPLFVKTEQETDEMDGEITLPEETMDAFEEEIIYIQLNERGRNGSNIRSEADLSNGNNIIGGVNEKSEIIYQGEWLYDGERYWILVYIPSDNIEGWLSGNLVDSVQLNEIVDIN